MSLGVSSEVSEDSASFLSSKLLLQHRPYLPAATLCVILSFWNCTAQVALILLLCHSNRNVVKTQDDMRTHMVYKWLAYCTFCPPPAPKVAL